MFLVTVTMEIENRKIFFPRVDFKDFMGKIVTLIGKIVDELLIIVESNCK